MDTFVLQLLVCYFDLTFFVICCPLSSTLSLKHFIVTFLSTYNESLKDKQTVLSIFTRHTLCTSRLEIMGETFDYSNPCKFYTNIKLVLSSPPQIPCFWHECKIRMLIVHVSLCKNLYLGPIWTNWILLNYSFNKIEKYFVIFIKQWFKKLLLLKFRAFFYASWIDEIQVHAKNHNLKKRLWRLRFVNPYLL